MLLFVLVYGLWLFLCCHYLMLSHFHEELREGRGGESCDTANYVNASMQIYNLEVVLKKEPEWSIVKYLTFWSNSSFRSVNFCGKDWLHFIAVYWFAYSAMLMTWYKIWKYVLELRLGFDPTTAGRSRLTTETPTLFLKSSENGQMVVPEFPTNNSAVIVRIHLQWTGCVYWEKFVYLPEKERPWYVSTKQIKAFNL